ncbi:MAG: hypothetical protein ACF8GE_06400 [Phycisphaerales bacterium JB043]
MHRMLTPLLATSLLSTGAMGASFDLDTVSPEAAAIVHVDLGALRDSALGPLLEAAAAEAGADISEAIGDDVDLFELLDTLTVYVVADSFDDVDENNIVVLVQGDNDLVDLLDTLRDEVDDVDTERSGGYTFEQWSMDDEDETVFMHTDRGRRGTSITVTFNEDLMVHALEILDDEEDSYSDAHGDAFDDADDAMVFVIADTDAAPELDGPGSMALEFARSVSAMITDEGDALGVALSIETGSVDDAERLSKMVEGLLAMTEFAMAAEDELDEEAMMFIELAKSASVDVKGNRFNVSIELDEDVLEELLEHADY